MIQIFVTFQLFPTSKCLLFVCPNSFTQFTESSSSFLLLRNRGSVCSMCRCLVIMQLPCYAIQHYNLFSLWVSGRRNEANIDRHCIIIGLSVLFFLKNILNLVFLCFCSSKLLVQKLSSKCPRFDLARSEVIIQIP